MRIELETPYKELFKYGYLFTNRENRKHVYLYREDKSRTTMSYARYLMSVKLGYILSQEFEVDHKDNDKTNDDIDNLQVLTKAEHRAKTIAERPSASMTELMCSVCGGFFLLATRNLPFRIGTTCSKKCGGIKASKTLAAKRVMAGCNPEKDTDKICPVCDIQFKYPTRLCKIREDPCCSRSCKNKRINLKRYGSWENFLKGK